MRKKFKDLGAPGFAKGGEVAKELKFMKDKGAPKSMVAAEKKEHGLAGGGSSGGGSAGSAGKSRFVGHGAFNFSGKKAKPFAEGGSTFAEDVAKRKADTGADLMPSTSADSTGPNPNIDDATRARAMAAVGGSSASQPIGFKDAFKAARGSGAKTFEWHGKKFNTDLAGGGGSKTEGPSHAPGPVVVQKSTTIYSNEGKGKAPPAAAAAAPAAKPAARDTTGFAETAFNKLRSAFDEEPRPKSGMRQTGMGPMPYAAGGAIDGCARKGKTRGKVV